MDQTTVREGWNGHEFHPANHPNAVCCQHCGLESAYWDDMTCIEYLTYELDFILESEQWDEDAQWMSYQQYTVA